MEYALERLTESLQASLKLLKGSGKAELIRELHDHSKLPNKRLSAIVPRTINLLHEVEQLLEPGSSVLADHFLGKNVREPISVTLIILS